MKVLSNGLALGQAKQQVTRMQEESPGLAVAAYYETQ